jgi:adenylate kinase family enzyme
MGRRINILGGSGSGTSTLARVLATRLASQAFDADDFYWHPTDPPFQKKRAPAERLALMEALFLPRSDWLLAGSISGWGDPLIPSLTHVVYLTLAPEARIIRLRRRERQRLGRAILPGGPQEQTHRAFLDYAMSYDFPDFPGRNRQKHELWMAELSCPVIRLDATPPPEKLADQVIEALDPTRAEA